jgi:hypothetical protein
LRRFIWFGDTGKSDGALGGAAQGQQEQKDREG